MGILIFKSKTVSETHPREASIFSTNVALVFLYEHALKGCNQIMACNNKATRDQKKISSDPCRDPCIGWLWLVFLPIFSSVGKNPTKQQEF